MAWLPIQYTVPQYWKQAADGTNEYSGAVLKAYQVGTTTNIPFATDNEGMTTANSIALNANGNPEVGGNVVIPHLDQDYKLAFYPDQASADSDSGAIWTIDDIDLVQTSDTATAADYNVWPLVDYGGAYFDGTNDYLTRGAGLTGASDGKAGTIVAFVTFDASATAIEYVVHSTGGAFILRRDSDGVFRIIAENASGSVILNMATQNAYNDANTVYCVMASWDLATPGSNQLYVNDEFDVATTTFTNDTVDYTVADWAVGADVSGSNKLTGNVLSVWFDQTDNLDFDTELNRRRFLDEQDNPVFLGVQGELPTGTQPILFLGNHDETAFETNRGSGGDFTENGTLAAASVDFDGQYHYNRFPNVNADVTTTDEELNTVVLNKFDATVAPTANDDSGDGYSVGSRWINTTDGSEYVCSDATAGAAKWQFVSPGAVDEIITSGSDNYTVPSGVTELIVTLVGGGGGGGGAGSDSGGGGGGGASGEVRTDRVSTSGGSTIAYSIGSGNAGGAGGGASGPSENGSAGTAGGNTTFGALTASGGNAGSGGQGSEQGGAGGSGGSAVSLDGSNGSSGEATVSGGAGGGRGPSGSGGSGGSGAGDNEGSGGGGGGNTYGNGGAGGDATTTATGEAGDNATGFGAGGGGGGSATGTGTAGGAGGAGADGLIIVQTVRP